MRKYLYLYIVCFMSMLLHAPSTFAGAPPDAKFEDEVVVKQTPPAKVQAPTKAPVETVKAPTPAPAVSTQSKAKSDIVIPYKEVLWVRTPADTPSSSNNVVAPEAKTAPVSQTSAQAPTQPVVKVVATDTVLRNTKPPKIEYPTPPQTLYRKEYGVDVNPKKLEMQELKLQMREVASQLLDVYPGYTLKGTFALPTSFVNLSDFSETSDLGRYMGEAMIYEFNTRGFPVQEYRIENQIYTNEEGEFVLSREFEERQSTANDELLLIGTYLKDENGLFVNARLVRNDGMVLRSAQTVIPMNNMLARMTKKAPPPPLSSGILMIKGK